MLTETLEPGEPKRHRRRCLIGFDKQAGQFALAEDGLPSPSYPAVAAWEGHPPGTQTLLLSARSTVAIGEGTGARRAARALPIVCVAIALLAALATPPLAAAQRLEYPLAIAAHGETIYLADRTLPGVWKLEAGKLTVFFQASQKFRTPLNAPRCLAVDDSGRVYAGDSSTREVYRFDADGQPKPLTSGSIGIPMGIAVTGEGHLLVSDLEVGRIWKVTMSEDQDAKTEKYADVPAPAGVRLDGEGRLWVVSRGDNALYRVATDGKVDVVAAGRQFEFPHEVAIASDGTAFVSDGYARAVWRLPKDEKAEKWVSGEPFVYPVGLAWQGDKLLVVDPRAQAVFQIDTDGQISALELGQSAAD